MDSISGETNCLPSSETVFEFLEICSVAGWLGRRTLNPGGSRGFKSRSDHLAEVFFSLEPSSTPRSCL